MNAQANDVRARIIVALDLPTREAALQMARTLSPHPGFFKIGLQLFIVAGPEIVRAVRDLGSRIFLDLKLHDIPNTVGRAVESAGSLGAEMLTIHLSGGREMIEAAVQAAPPEMLLLGVTVLTSSNDKTLRETGVSANVEEQVLQLAKLGVESRLRGFVASPHELASLRRAHGDEIKIVTPGIRPSGTAPNDQKRAMTPAEALHVGADYLVIGRPITAAPDPRAALEKIAADAL
ncbi:MAG TPA: orotidine-5'-phosphate decarboxylase [Chthoniobacterales bacterium]|nr:orotidine-5'-phosphate decarboxylase [Chthoniobacterales bacterium]